VLPIAIVLAALVSGCSTTSESENAAWLGEGKIRAGYDPTAGGMLDPVTAIAAAQHPLSRHALQQLGTHYRFGGTSPDTGFDCSGLIHYSARESIGLTLPRRSAELARTGKAIKRQDLAVGDLVFFNTRGGRYSHVGIYLGNNLFVHAPSSGGKVRVENMTTQYWKKRYTGARRIDIGNTGVMLATSQR
jgi:cell wall-associated NlpC family hydrolase